MFCKFLVKAGTFKIEIEFLGNLVDFNSRDVKLVQLFEICNRAFPEISHPERSIETLLQFCLQKVPKCERFGHSILMSLIAFDQGIFNDFNDWETT